MPGEPQEVVVLTAGQLRRMLVEAAETAARKVLAEGGIGREWMSRVEVAAMLGYRPSYISELVRRRGLPCHWAGRKMRFRREEVGAWAERSRGSCG